MRGGREIEGRYDRREESDGIGIVSDPCSRMCSGHLLLEFVEKKRCWVKVREPF